MTEQLISMRWISDNPYQPRTVDDPEHIENLARSIAADDLLQKPRARHFGKNGSHQLAFGHSRRKAFEWLKANWQAQGLPDRYAGYTVMPVEVADMTDEEMYRFAISENIQRKDLNPIELAQAMIKYRDEFKKTSEEVGQLFGMNGATVRGMVRLLDLPESIQGKVASGEMTQGIARKLLTVSQVDESKVLVVAEDIAAGADPDAAIESSIRNDEKTVRMWESWRRDEKPRAGSNLWALDLSAEKFPAKYLPRLTAAHVAKACGLEFTADLRQRIDDRYLVTVTDPAKAASLTEMHPEDAGLIERIVHLSDPPACATCPFHAVVAKSHYCGLKACHQRKTQAWVTAEITRVSKRLGIAIYDPAQDGKAFVPLCEHSYMDEYKRHAKLVEEKDVNLRLAPHKNEYSIDKFTDSHFVRVILVGEGAQAAKEKKEKVHAREQAQVENRQLKWQQERERRDAADTFTRQYAGALFATVFRGMTHIPALCVLADSSPKKNAKKAEILSSLHKDLALHVIERQGGYSYSLREKGPTAVAKYLQKTAAAWGVKLPKDFLEIAKGYEPAVARSVATETGQAKK